MSIFDQSIGSIISSGLKVSSQRGAIQLDVNTVINRFIPNFLNPGSAGSDPTSIINRATNKVGQYQFPDDIGKYYMSMKFYQYKRPSVFAKLTLTTDNFLVLPLPVNLTDSYSLNYNPETQSGAAGYAAEALTAAGIDGINPAGAVLDNTTSAIASVVGANSGLDVSGAMKAAAGELGSAGNTLSGAAVAGGAAGLINLANQTTLGRAGLQALGIAENPYLTVVFGGPTFKTHTFQWLLSPRTASETANLTTIINMFKKAAHPDLASGTAAFIYPNIVQMEIKPTDTQTHMYTFKKCVITNIRADYTPGQPAFFGDTSAPVQVVLTIQFQEIELWTAKDWPNANTGAAQTSITAQAKSFVGNVANVTTGGQTAAPVTPNASPNLIDEAPH